jgi:O-antigen ligase
VSSRILAGALFVVLTAALLVAWSPRYWPVTILHCGVFAIAIAWLLMHVFRPAPIRWSLLFIPAAAAGLWGVLQLSVGNTVYRFETSKASLYWLSNAVALFVAAQVLRDSTVRRGFLKALAVLATLIAIVGTLQYFTSPQRIYWIFPAGPSVYAFGPFVYRNQFAALMELAIPLPLYLLLSGRRHRWAFSLMSAMLFAAVIATASRAGVALAMLEGALIFVLAWRRGLVSGRTLVVTLTPVAALGLVLTLVVGFENVWSRFHESSPYALRGKLAASSVEMIRSRPLTGYGLGTWATVYPEFATFDNGHYVNQAHNDWLQWTAEGGVFFGLALALLAGGASILAWRTLWGVGVFFVFLHSWIDYPTGEPVIGAILFVLIGAMIAAGRREALAA